MPGAAATVSGLALMFGGASILLGVKPKYGVAALAAFLVIVSPVTHGFWNAPSEPGRVERAMRLAKRLAA